MAFLVKFWIFSPKNRFSSQNVKKKEQKWCQNGSNSIISGVMTNFWFCEIQKSDISPPEKSKKLRGFANFQ